MFVHTKWERRVLCIIEVPGLEEHTCTITIKGNKIILHWAYENNGIVINQVTINWIFVNVMLIGNIEIMTRI